MSFLFGFWKMFSADFFSLDFLKFAWWISFLFGYWASLGHILPTRPLFEKSVLPIHLDCFKMFLIDFSSIWIFGNCLNWFCFIWIDGSVLNWFLFLSGFCEMFFIYFFSIWLLGQPWGTLCQRDPSFEKIVLPIYLDCFDFLLLDSCST